VLKQKREREREVIEIGKGHTPKGQGPTDILQRIYCKGYIATDVQISNTTIVTSLTLSSNQEPPHFIFKIRERETDRQTV
jgi:hypothetical protein